MIIVAIILILLLWGISGYVVFSIAIKSKSDKSIVFGKHVKSITHQKEYGWLCDAQEKTIMSSDGLRLHGYEYVKPSNKKFCILLHGYGGQAKNMVDQMDHFIDMGYNVVAVDLRGHGKSEGKYYGLGVLDKNDVRIWINTIKKYYNCNDIVIYGTSMGGAIAIMTGALCINGVSAIVTDSAPSDFTLMFSRILNHRIGKYFGWVVIKSLELFVKVKAGYSLSEASAIKNISDVTVPILFIHGTNDGFVPPIMMENLYASCISNKSKLLVEGAEHTKSAQVNPIVYWNTIKIFLQSSI